MKLALEWLTARCAVVSIQDGGLYHTEMTYRLTLNGAPYGTTGQVITPVFGLAPDTTYTLGVEGEEGTGEHLAFHTPYEYVTLDIRAFGAQGDGETNDTAAIQAAIMACPKDSRVLIPEGRYRVSHLFLKDGLRLELGKGAVLEGIPQREGLPILPGMIESTDEKQEYNLGSWEGNPLPMYASLLTGLGAKDVAVYGPGVLDGKAAPDNWWKDAKKLNRAWRPRMVFLNRCEDVTLVGLTVQNSPSWHIHPYFSKRVRLLGLHIISPQDSPNTDGIDPESSQHVEMKGIRFSLGDDCVALKSGKRYMGDTYGVPCQGVHIAHCEMGDGHGAVTLGSEMSGGIRDVLVEHCYFHDTDRGLRIKTRRGRGKNAVIDGIRFSHIRMQNVKTPFAVNCFYFCDPDGRAAYVQDRALCAVQPDTPQIGSLIFEDIHCTDCHAAATYFLGLPERPIGFIAMKDVDIAFADKPIPEVPIMTVGMEPCIGLGLWAENVDTLKLENVHIQGATGEATALTNVKNFERH